MREPCIYASLPPSLSFFLSRSCSRSTGRSDERVATRATGTRHQRTRTSSSLWSSHALALGSDKLRNRDTATSTRAIASKRHEQSRNREREWNRQRTSTISTGRGDDRGEKAKRNSYGAGRPYTGRVLPKHVRRVGAARKRRDAMQAS